MGNTLTTNTPSFLLQHGTKQHQHQQQPSQPQKPLKDRPSSSVKEPAFQGYVAGWRQSSFDSDAQEFSFATFQQSQAHVNNTSLGEGDGEAGGYEGDDEDSQHQDQRMEVGRISKSDFESLDRGRGLGRNGSLRERDKAALNGGGGEGYARTWKERKFEEREPSLERKLERVRWVVGEEHALPRIGRGEGVARG